ncbi:MAG: glycosyltransferase family 4 protein [Acidimicrobiales bacterium]
MNLLFLCPHFEPDLHAATGEVMTRLVHALGDRGHTIHVVTSLPWYRQHDVEAEWRGRPWRRETTSFGTVTRVWPFPTDKGNIPARAAGFAGFNALVLGAALSTPKPDAILAMSPPIVIGDAGWLAAKRYRVPFVFNVQDIFPDVAVDLGALSNKRVIAAARWYERSIYARADAVTVLSQDQAANVAAKIRQAGADTRVEVIHNFVDLERVTVVDRINPFRAARRLGDDLVVGYSGNVGLSQSFDLVRHAAEVFADTPGLRFLINGEGAARPAVNAWAATMPNVTVGDFVARHEVSDALGAIDLHLILLKAGLAKSSTPSKLYGILAAGRPILASIDEGSEVAAMIADADCGRSIPPDDKDAFVAALREMLADRQLLAAQGKRARAFVEAWMTPEAQAMAYEKLFTQLIEADA